MVDDRKIFIVANCDSMEGLRDISLDAGSPDRAGLLQ
jgi:hypothetical protein